MLGFKRVLFRLFFIVAGVNSVFAIDAKHTLLIDEHFSEGLADWVWTGPPDSKVAVVDGAVLLDPLEAKHRSPGTEGINFWYRQPLEGDWAIEFDLEPIQPGPSDGESCNLLFMVDYRYENRELDFIENVSRETGHYPFLHGAANLIRALEEATGLKYHPKTGYTITYYRINPQEEPSYRMVVRRNPGFHLVHQENQTRADQWNFRHSVRIERRGRVLRLFQDDRLALEAIDSSEEPPPSGGYFGMRTWKTKVKLHGVRVDRLESSPAPSANTRQSGKK